jgi:hypothetical protein
VLTARRADLMADWVRGVKKPGACQMVCVTRSS